MVGVGLAMEGEGDLYSVDAVAGANLDGGDAVGGAHVPCRPSVPSPRPHLDLSVLHHHHPTQNPNNSQWSSPFLLWRWERICTPSFPPFFLVALGREGGLYIAD